MAKVRIEKQKCPCGQCLHAIEHEGNKNHKGENIFVVCKFSPFYHLKGDDSYCKEYKPLCE